MVSQIPASDSPHVHSLFDLEVSRSIDIVEGRCVIGRVEDIPPGKRRIFSIGGRQGIGIFNLGDEYVALRNVCPHRGGPLCYGRVGPHVIANAAGEIDFEREGEILKCPWHRWEFDLRTGWSLYAPHLRVQTYSVTIEDGWIILQIDE